ncbi:MAG: flagellar hook-associated protein 3 [Deltaproteobacteria bacterium]|nr:flagellar hook-associated protein 3 [Deltaproteobacteria bacterium]
MRVTHKSLQQSWVQDLQRRLGNLDRLNRQIGSGKRMTQPADDPAGASRLVRLQEVVARNRQYVRNIDEALAVHRSTESALEQAYNHLVRAKSIAVEGANIASAPLSGSYTALADEVAGIREGLLQIAQGRHEDKYLFNGTAGEKAPFQSEGESVRYQGNSERLRVNMGNGQSVAVNLPGDIAFRETEARSRDDVSYPLDLEAAPLTFTVSDGTYDVEVTLDGTYANASDLAAAVDAALREYEDANGVTVNLEALANDDGTWSLRIADSEKGGEITVAGAGALGLSDGTRNMFELLSDLEAALRSEDPQQVAGLLDRLDRGLHDLVTQRGLVGARSRNLDLAKNRLEAFNAAAEEVQAGVEGVDLPETVMRLTSEEQAYQTALAAGARLFNISILDYLT